MTELLEEAIAKARNLPDERQDEIAWKIFDFIAGRPAGEVLGADSRRAIETELHEREAKGLTLGPDDIRAAYARHA